MEKFIIAIDQSTSATKALLFDEQCKMVGRCDIAHKQYYPCEGYVEHDAEEIYQNTVEAIRQVVAQLHSNTVGNCGEGTRSFSLAITNQRETVVVWNKHTGKPIAKAVVWQDTRGAEICRQLREDGKAQMVQQKSGLMIDPNFSASGVKWLLDNVEGARAAADNGDLLMGTIDTWLVWKLTGGKSFFTDTTNASRTMLFNIHTMDWDDELLRLFDIPRSMVAEVLPCDAVYGETTVDGLFEQPVQIAGVLGDSHGALVGQMCFSEGSGKVTYGTGSSVMVNIGQEPKDAPAGLVTSVGFSAFGKHYYGYEGNIYSTGATLKWMCDQLQLIDSPAKMEAEATSVADNGGVYIVPAFAGLGAPWWKPDAKAAIVGMTFATTRSHVVRAGLESIAYQIKDLTDVMVGRLGDSSFGRLGNSSFGRLGDSSFGRLGDSSFGRLGDGEGKLQEICADGGPTRNGFLMQFQADLLGTPIVCTEVEDASAFGAVLMNGFARKVWNSFEEVTGFRKVTRVIYPSSSDRTRNDYAGWLKAVEQIAQ